ncbi:hypothetical protein N9226_00065 [bacterium]|jgi:hypothetical protein|nr:hypothetical protein [bacterium]MDB4538498.1 hypothetical protein [bacterium]
MVSMLGACLRLAPVMAPVMVPTLAVIALVGCRGTEHGKIGVSVSKEVPVLGPVAIDFETGWCVAFGSSEVCGCVTFLGPDGKPLEGAAVGEIRHGRGSGSIPEGATGWRVLVADEDCDRLDCSTAPGLLGASGDSLSEAAAWLAAPMGPQNHYVLLGSRLLADDSRVRISDLGSWQRATFQDMSATVVAPDGDLAWALLELQLDAGPAVALSSSQRAVLSDRVTVHEALRLNLDGPQLAPLGFVGEVVRTGGVFGAQIVVNGSTAFSGVSRAPGLPGELPTVSFDLPLGFVDFDPLLRWRSVNQMTIRCKDSDQLTTSTRLKVTFDPSDG